MIVLFDLRAEKELKKFSKPEQAKVREYIKLFVEFGFNLDTQYLKKIDANIWELRPKSIRIFMVIISPNCTVIHAMKKKSHKITKATLKIIKQRARQYL